MISHRPRQWDKPTVTASGPVLSQPPHDTLQAVTKGFILYVIHLLCSELLY